MEAPARASEAETARTTAETAETTAPPTETAETTTTRAAESAQSAKDPASAGAVAPVEVAEEPTRVPGHRRAFSAVDFVLRLAFFAVAPIAITIVGNVMPIWGIVVNVGVALAVFFVAHRVRRVPILGRVLGRALRFEAYYREHAPKPFLYYVFFPLLFPYWLVVKSARREVAVYRPFTGVPLVVLVATNSWQFFARYRPEIPFTHFAVVTAAKIVVELAAVMLFLMPVASTVVTYERQRKPWHLAITLAAALASIGWCVHRHVANPPRVASTEVQLRASWRTAFDGKRAHATLLAAVNVARKHLLDDAGQLPAGDHELDGDTWIEGGALEAAQEKLEEFYKPDEARGFRLTIVRSIRGERALLLFQARSGPSLPRVWIAVTRSGKQFADDSIPKSTLVLAQLGKLPKKKIQAPKKAPSATAPDVDASAAPPIDPNELAAPDGSAGSASD